MDLYNKETAVRDKFILKLLLTDKAELTPEELEYFRKYPDDIDEITAPVNVHKLFLILGTVLGFAFVIISKIINFQTVVLIHHVYLKEVIVDIIFEIGVALVGGGVTAFLLGILLNVQQKKAVQWRKKIRRNISQKQMDSE
jgi:hypothetical protein